MSLKIKTGKIKNYHSIEIHGDILGNEASKITAKVEQMIRKSIDVIVIHFFNTTLIDSIGLGAFVYIWKLLNSTHKKLIFLCPPDFDRNLFSSANLDKLFTIVSTVEEI